MDAGLYSKNLILNVKTLPFKGVKLIAIINVYVEQVGKKQILLKQIPQIPKAWL